MPRMTARIRVTRIRVSLGRRSLRGTNLSMVLVLVLVLVLALVLVPVLVLVLVPVLVLVLAPRLRYQALLPMAQEGTKHLALRKLWMRPRVARTSRSTPTPQPRVTERVQAQAQSTAQEARGTCQCAATGRPQQLPGPTRRLEPTRAAAHGCTMPGTASNRAHATRVRQVVPCRAMPTKRTVCWAVARRRVCSCRPTLRSVCRHDRSSPSRASCSCLSTYVGFHMPYPRGR